MNREEVISSLLKIENNLPVQEWRYGDIQLWPYLKVKLFFELFNEHSTGFAVNQLELPNRTARIVNAIGNYRQSKIKMHNKETLFFGAPIYRSMLNGVYVNRFFKPLEENNPNYLYLENGVKPKGINYPDEILEVYKLLDFYRFTSKFRNFKRELNCHHWKDINRIAPIFAATANKLSKQLESIGQNYILISSAYEALLRNTKINKMYGLCYYSMELSAMHYVCNKLGIENIDVQHGGVGNLHSAYTFSNFPNEGYNTLPQKFHVWDHVTSKHLSTWLSESDRYEIKVTGNPWLNYVIDHSNKTIEEKRKIVLFTLQFHVIDDYLIDAIKLSSDKYIWWIRLHPRMSAEKELIKNQLRKSDVLHKVNIDEATSLPLPLILKRCHVHISKYSGSIVEAVQFNKKSIVLEQIGNTIYHDYIADGVAIGLIQPTGVTIWENIENN